MIQPEPDAEAALAALEDAKALLDATIARVHAVCEACEPNSYVLSSVLGSAVFTWRNAMPIEARIIITSELLKLESALTFDEVFSRDYYRTQLAHLIEVDEADLDAVASTAPAIVAQILRQYGEASPEVAS